MGHTRHSNGLTLSFENLPELWTALTDGQGQGDRGVLDRFKLIVIPAGLWGIWRTRNARIFKDQPVYFENLWEETAALIQDWGRYLVGAKAVIVTEGTIRVEE
ncbi:hypothetical protein QJS10_CPA08g00539 [Acorus calamus]|uniref:Uncharacterized protein n=1 Tax=Acorus calamus TaxID=4465 RepID=A0AAV9E9P0_ACOCL|nr:hypothetical protein QJS10_CPA08g00539 [Acorus calamus]